MLVYAMPVMCDHYAPRAHSYRRHPVVPCFAPLLAVSAIFLLPTLLRLALLMFVSLAVTAVHVIWTVGVGLAIGFAVRALFCDDDDCESKNSERGCRPRACFARMKARAQEARAQEARAQDAQRAHGDRPKPAKKRHHDLSSARLEATTEGVKVVVIAPGVAPSDLDVSVVDNSLRIKGETSRGVDVFCVDHHIVPPRFVDMTTAACTHADGEVTITLSKKVGRRIPVTAAARSPATTEEPVAVEKQAQEADAKEAVKEATAEGTEGEWEPVA